MTGRHHVRRRPVRLRVWWLPVIVGALLAAGWSGAAIAAGSSNTVPCTGTLSATYVFNARCQLPTPVTPPPVTSTVTVTATSTVTASPTGTGSSTPPVVSASPTITPLPTGSPSGNNCILEPSACGYPDATNTGPDPAVALRPSGSLKVTKAGTTITGLEVTGCIEVDAPNVTITNTVVHGTGCQWVVHILPAATNAALDHVEIDGTNSTGKDGSPDAGLYGFGFTATALNIHDTGDAVDIESGDTLTDSWLHDIRQAGGSHSDGIQATGATGIVIEHNTILAIATNDNAGVILGADQGDITNVTVDNNIIDGRNVAVNAGNNPGYKATGIVFSSNRIGDTAQYGPCNTNNRSTNNITFTGNVWDATGKAISC